MKFTSAELVVQRQHDAVNARDVEAMLAAHAHDAHQFEFPGRLLASGHPQIRQRVLRLLADPAHHARLVSRSVFGNTVIDHLDVSRTLAEGAGRLEVIAIHVVDRGLIRTSSFLFGAEVVDARLRA
ncbi:nuclear transport factor 2 family protein [Aquabacterium sp.]|uniref:nuclear transport factor 2 family protein n=1 Tax=Aquabacterium sp. TaxID=1872578 RepID=UPI003783F06C